MTGDDVTTQQLDQDRTLWLDRMQSAGQATPEAPPRRLRGLRMPVLPTGAWLAQVGGALAGLAGVWMQFGVPVALMVGGAAAVVVGALREAGKI